MSKVYDLIVIGAGSGGVRCARVAASLGAKVAVIESRYMGGTCVNVGCIPKKLLVYASHFSSEFEHAEGYGWNLNIDHFEWEKLLNNKDKEIKRLNTIYRGILEKSEVDVFTGHARFQSSTVVQVGEQILSGKAIVIATGGWPKRPTYPGSEHVVTSNEFFSLPSLPKRVLVEGGGYIAVELAGILNGLGCQTDLLYRGPLFLRGFDHDIREFIAQQMRDKGICLNFSSEIACIDKTDGNGLAVTLKDGREMEVDSVVSAIGRQALVDGLSLENTEVSLCENGFVSVDNNFRTSDEAIFAVGDVVGRLPLTPVALREGAALANYLFAHKPVQIDYKNVPTAVFSQPEIAVVGLTEEQACIEGIETEIYSSEFRPLKYTLVDAPDRTLMKVIVRKSDEVVIGCHIAGDYAAEMMQGVAVAVNMGATKTQLDNTLGIHPTSAEELVTMR